MLSMNAKLRMNKTMKLSMLNHAQNTQLESGIEMQ